MEEVKELIENSIAVNSAVVVNIKYFPPTKVIKKKKFNDLVKYSIIPIPEKILKVKNKNKDKYFDMIESHVYNYLSIKAKRNVASCQIYVYDEDAKTKMDEQNKIFAPWTKSEEDL